MVRVRKHGEITADTGSIVTGRLVDAYGNIPAMKMYASVPDEDRETRKSFAAHVRALANFTRTLTGMRISISVLNGLMISFVAVLAVALWMEGQATTGTVTFTLGLVLRLNLMFGRLMGSLNALFRNIGITQNSMELVARPLQLSDRAGAATLDEVAGHVHFKNVAFSYGNETAPVVSNLDFEIAPGEKVGIVGASGAGKSTIVNLLLRFYDVNHGCITIDGHDIAQLTQDSLRQHFSLVQQETGLLSRSVRDNVKFGRPEASDAQIYTALGRASASEFVAVLEDNKGRTGLDAHIGERGIKLSGGQRQRIALARFFLREEQIMVLDEATSAIDSQTESEIINELRDHLTGRTAIMIAHRLSTIAWLDRLIVLDDGKVAETGTHSELLELSGIYAKLWEKQGLRKTTVE